MRTQKHFYCSKKFWKIALLKNIVMNTCENTGKLEVKELYLHLKHIKDPLTHLQIIQNK